MDMQRIIADVPSRGDFPAAARIIERLRTAVARENSAAVDVARIVLGDPGTASKVLRLANSVFYRKGGEPISTITRAVIVLGFEAICDLATGLVLIDELLREAPSRSDIRDRLRHSLLVGLLARRFASQVGFPNAEEAYLLGLFADWGLVWLAAYYHSEFERVVAYADAKQVSLADATRRVLGQGAEALAAAILDHWNFPTAFGSHFRQPAPTSRNEVAAHGARLSALVHLAADYADVLDAGAQLPPQLLERAQRLFGLRPEQVQAAAAAATDALREQAPILGLGTFRPARKTTPPAGATAPATAPPPPETEAVAALGDASATLSLVAEITRSIVEQRDVNEVLLMILEGVARMGRFDVVFLALLSQDRDRLVGRFGYGEGVEKDIATLSVPVRPGAGFLADTVLARTPGVVDGGAARLVPAGAPAPAIPATSYAACPLVVRAKTIGVLAAGRVGTPAAGTTDLPTVELFCNQAAVALQQYAR